MSFCIGVKRAERTQPPPDRTAKPRRTNPTSAAATRRAEFDETNPTARTATFENATNEAKFRRRCPMSGIRRNEPNRANSLDRTRVLDTRSANAEFLRNEATGRFFQILKT